MPDSCIGRNARIFLSKSQWDMIRRWCYRRAGYQCEYCGAVGIRVECHEEWDFIMVQEHYIQKLVGLKCLCGNCHYTTHLKHPKSLVRLGHSGELLIGHLRKVNEWSEGVTKEVVRLALRERRKRSKYRWELDLMWMVAYFGLPNFVLHHPPYEVEVNFDDVKCE